MPPYERQWNLRQRFQRAGGIIRDQVDGLYAERILNPGMYQNFFDPFDKIPQANATLDQAATVEAWRLTNPNWETAGTGVADADVTFNDAGGINLVVPGNDGDEVILVEHADANAGLLSIADWDTDLQPLFICNIEFGASVVDMIAWLGWKLTSTEVTVTDADQAFFRYEDNVISGDWQAVTSVNGTDDAQDADIPIVASTAYRMCIHLDANRVPRYYINGGLVETGSALDAGDAIIPVIGVAVDGGAAATKTLIVRNCFISQLIG